MQYPEFQKSKYGVSYRFLESIENKDYWQVDNCVVSCLPNTERADDGFPLDNTEVCPFVKWEEIRSHILKRASQPPFKEYKLPCVCCSATDRNKSVIHHFVFYSIAEILDSPEITGLYIQVDKFHDEGEYCSLYAEHGTGYACCRGYIKKSLLMDFSQKNISRFIKISKESTPDFMVQFMLDFLNDKIERHFDYGAETVVWLKKLNYDTSEIMQAAEARKLRVEQDRLAEQAKKEAEELAKKEQEVQQRSQSLITVRNLLFGDKSCIFSDIPFGHESLIFLIEKHVGKVPLRTKGWIYNNLYSMTGENYKYRGGDSKTFNKLIYSLRDILKENKQ